LGNLTSVGSADVEADHSILVSLVNENFDIAVTFRACLVVGPLKWLEASVESRDIVRPINILSILLAVSARSILERCKNGSGNINVVHLLCHATE
jgi:hypothetical protein